MDQEHGTRPDLTGEVRVRVPLPIVIPIVALIVIALAAVGFSRVLLAVPSEAAVVVALVTAANVLGACAFFAARPERARAAWPELAVVVLYPVIIGVAIAQTDIGEEAAHHEPAPRPGGGVNTVVAEGFAFTPQELEVHAREEVTITFENNDSGAQHNMAIYASDAAIERDADPLFEGELITGVASTDYTFQLPPSPGFPFICEIHPSMTGTIIVAGS